MAEMPSLGALRLHDTRFCADLFHGWRYIFDALRDQTRGIKVRVDIIITYNAATVSLDSHTDDFQRVQKQEEKQNPWKDIYRSLSLYLSGKIE